MPRKKIGYDPNNKLSILGKTFRCPKLMQYKTFLSCPGCELFPCDFLDREDMEMLETSPFLHKTVTGFKLTRSETMEYIGKTKQGELEFLGEDFDPANPNIDTVTHYDEIYPINKVYVPQVKLTTKTKPDREQVKQDLEREQEAAQEKQGAKSVENKTKRSEAKQKGVDEVTQESDANTGKKKAKDSKEVVS